MTTGRGSENSFPLDRLPEELLLRLGTYLTPQERCYSMARVSQTCYRVFRDAALWRSFSILKRETEPVSDPLPWFRFLSLIGSSVETLHICFGWDKSTNEETEIATRNLCLPVLKTLHLSSTLHFHHPVYRHLIEQSRLLKEMYLVFNQGVSVATLRTVMRVKSSLHTLHLTVIPTPDRPFVEHHIDIIGYRCTTTLRTLMVIVPRVIHPVPSICYLDGLRHLSHLQHLTLRMEHMNNTCVEGISACTQLKTLILENCVGLHTISRLSVLQNLECLSLIQCEALTFPSMETFFSTSKPKLEYLYLRKTPISYNIMRNMTHSCVNVRVVKLCECHNELSFQGCDYTTDMLATLETLKYLEGLKVCVFPHNAMILSQLKRVLTPPPHESWSVSSRYHRVKATRLLTNGPSLFCHCGRDRW